MKLASNSTLKFYRTQLSCLENSRKEYQQVKYHQTPNV